MVYTDPAALQLLPGALLGTLACAWAGLAWAQSLLPVPHDDETPLALLLAVALGFGLTASLAFWMHGVGGPRVSAQVVVVVAQAQVVVVAWRRRGQVRAVVVPDQRWMALRGHGRWWLLPTLAVGLLWLLRHDASIPPASCIGEAAICAVGQGPAGCDVLRHNIGDAQLGNAALVAGALALYGAIGFQLLYALAGAMAALGGWAVAAAAVPGAGRGGLLLALVATACNPYVLSIPLLDENVLTLAWSLPCLGLLLRAPARLPDRAGLHWLMVGVLLGMVGNLRHPMAAVAPAVLAYVAVQATGGRNRAVGFVGLGALGATAFEHVHHYLAIGSVFQFEHNLQYAPLPYTVAGHRLQWAGMLNWPIHSELVRTPENPFPMLVGWWLWLADHFGWVALALSLVGAAVLARRRRATGLLLLGWFGPVLLGLSVQEAWDYPNKMGILLIAAAAWPGWWAQAWQYAGQKPLQTGIAVLLLAAAGQAAVLGLAGWQVAADPRYFKRFGLEPVECRARLAVARQRALDIGWLPDYGRMFRYSTVGRPWLAGPLLHSPDPVPWGWLPGEAPPPGPPVVLELDLSVPPWQLGGVQWRPSADFDVDVTQQRGLAVLTDLAVPWEPTPLVATVLRGPTLTVVELALRDFRRREPGCDPAQAFCHCQFLDALDPGALPQLCSGMTAVRATANKLRLRLPAGGVSVIFTANPAGNVVDLWRGVVDGQGGALGGPLQFWHN